MLPVLASKMRYHKSWAESSRKYVNENQSTKGAKS